MQSVWREVRYKYKVESVGAVLEHRTSGEFCYYYVSSNNAFAFSEVDPDELFAAA